MAGKFTIFCDDCPRSTFEPEDKPMAISQQPQQQSQSSQPLKPIYKSSTITNDLQHQIQQQQQLAASKLASVNINHEQVDKFVPSNQGVNLKREPLGLRQTSSQATTAASTGILSEPTASSTASSSSMISVNEEDQENDISMASLGSEFAPSIINDDYDRYILDGDGALVDDEEEEDEDDYDLDEELQLELSQAFKQHDESQLFKSTVYNDDILIYLNQLERKSDTRPLPNYMDFQNDIDSDKRAILVNWLVEVSDEYDLQTETLFICTNIIDRFLSQMSIPTSNFQLLGVAAMFIASKYEEIYPPNLYQFVEVTDDTYSGQQILQMEQEILKTLNFRISLPTISFFLRQIFAFNKFSKKVYHLAEYFCYLSLLADYPFLEYYPSEIALAAVILAAHQLDATSNISSELQSAYDKSNLDQLERRKLPKGVRTRDIDRRRHILNRDLPFCVESLVTMQQRVHERSSKLLNDTAIIQRFSSDQHSCVALLPPPKSSDIFLY